MKILNYDVTITTDAQWKPVEWRHKHWNCKITDGITSMKWDCYGGSLAIMVEYEALYYFLNDAYTFTDINDMDGLHNEFGINDYDELKRVYQSLKDTYNKAISFFGTEENFTEVYEYLRETYDL